MSKNILVTGPQRQRASILGGKSTSDPTTYSCGLHCLIFRTWQFCWWPFLGWWKRDQGFSDLQLGDQKVTAAESPGKCNSIFHSHLCFYILIDHDVLLTWASFFQLAVLLCTRWAQKTSYNWSEMGPHFSRVISPQWNQFILDHL